MASILFNLSHITSVATAIIMNMANDKPSSGAQNNTPIEIAATSHKWVFIAYIGSGFLLAVMTWIYSRSGDRVQDAIRKDADVRIAEAKSEGAKANERADKLENENLVLKGQVAGLQTDASNAKAAQQKVEIELTKQGTELSKQKELTAKAEKDLFELRERMQPRRISAAQRARLVSILSHAPKGKVFLICVLGDREGKTFANDINEVMKAAGWPGDDDLKQQIFSGGGPVGIAIIVRDAKTAPAYAGALQQAFFSVGIPLAGVENPELEEGRINLIVGAKP